MIRAALNCSYDLCPYRSHVNRNDSLGYLCHLNEILQTARHQKQPLQGPAMRLSCVRWNFLIQLKRLVSPVLIDMNRHYQTLILFRFKSVTLSPSANWDEVNATPLHATRAVALTGLMHLPGTWCALVFMLTFTQATHHAVWIMNIEMNCNHLGPAMLQHVLLCTQQLRSIFRKIKVLVRPPDYTEDS